MKIGFTGTRKGMTSAQKRTFLRLLRQVSATEFHHGDCLGADAEAHQFVADRYPHTAIIVHPAEDGILRAFLKGSAVREEAPYLDRNKVIVDETEELIATPGERKERKRGSGTWFTVRYAKAAGKKVTIIYPDGVVGMV